MIHPRSLVGCITIEKSKESKAHGEFVIDTAEYSNVGTEHESVVYFQLKHSTTRLKTPFAFSELEKTLVGFGARYASTKGVRKIPQSHRAFCFVSNRPVNERIKQAVGNIGKGKATTPALRKKLEKATKLSGDALRDFCLRLEIRDVEGDYIVQRQKLRGEVAELIAGFVDNRETVNLIALVESRAMPETEDGGKKGEIYREDVLQRLDVNSVRDLFPAPSELETLQRVITREQHRELAKEVVEAKGALIIHAAGGVGKSIVATQLSTSLPRGSRGIVYDCFGGGKYRNESAPRHRPCDAFVQIANELASLGLSKTFIGHASSPRDALYRGFLQRLEEAVKSLREIEPKALLAVFIDAADNAEMAAKEMGDVSFAGPLLRETIPAHCRLIYLCRTERVPDLQPPASIRKVLLKPFSRGETAAHLRSRFAGATDHDVQEFQRRTGGNPRVQAIALGGPYRDQSEMLEALGPTRTTVDDQIHEQLDAAIAALRGRNTAIVNAQIDSICRGLANLPPFIPLQVLATAAKVEVTAISSFVSDLGRPLWFSEDSVQFRDEPTETWFRNRFGADPAEIGAYADALEPLAGAFTYVAKALPRLLLRAGQFDRLIKLALSDEALPTNNPLDERDVRVYRLQFAFKAALRAKRLAEAAQLAFRAGEELAGSERQLKLLSENIDLVGMFQEPHLIQEYAYRKKLGANWEGSENAYSASLLSSVRDLHGDARSYLRAANRWLQLHFETRNAQQKLDRHYQDPLSSDHIVEFARAELNLFGPEQVAKYVMGWKPPKVTLDVTLALAANLVDAGRFDDIDAMSRHGAGSPALIVAVCHALSAVALYPERAVLERTLENLGSPKRSIKPPERHAYGDLIVPAILSFAEACAHHGLPADKVLALLDAFVPTEADRYLGSDHQEGLRRNHFRALSLRTVLTGTSEPPAENLFPVPAAGAEAKRRDHEEKQEFVQVVGAVLPWFVARAKLIVDSSFSPNLTEIRRRSDTAVRGRHKQHDRLPYEISPLHFDLLARKPDTPEPALQDFAKEYLKNVDSKYAFPDRLTGLRTACRHPHLASLRPRLEESSAEIIAKSNDEEPESISSYYVELARAVLVVSVPDAAAYFSHAVEAASNLGQEMLERWAAVLSAAKRAADEPPSSAELAYRFVRCGELIGNRVQREKHWSRNDVFRVALRLHPPSAFTALSRWRDRDVGWFDEQLLALAKAAVDRAVIDPVAGWCLSGFDGCRSSQDFLASCLAQPAGPTARQQMFDATVRDMEIDGILGENRTKLAAIGRTAKLSLGVLDAMPVAAKRTGSPALSDSSEPGAIATAAELDPRVTPILARMKPASAKSIATGFADFERLTAPKDTREFLSRLLAKVATGEETAFLANLVEAPAADTYDVRSIFAQAKQRWSAKASVRRAWPALFHAVGKRFARDLGRWQSMEYFLETCPLDRNELEQLKGGIIDALADSPDEVSAGNCFGFVDVVASRLSTAEAAELLEFALGRFERIMDNGFADGAWAPSLEPPATMVDTFTGFIWSALGAPQSWVRWEAVHCVRRLGEMGRSAEISSLVGWLRKGTVEAFGAPGHPFYRLHAELYLLIALARVGVECTDSLKDHAALFADRVISGMPHVLLQGFAAEIALAVERDHPGTLDATTVQKLRAVNLSPFPRRKYERNFDVSSPWHIAGTVDLTLKLHFAYDFDHYWFDQISDLFGIKPAEAEDLAREAAINLVGIPNEEYPEDGRRAQWRTQDYSSRSTSHSHGGYPEIDNYGFYYSYHAFLSVAARLLAHVPVRSDRDDDGDRWQEWLRRHGLTRNDGKWLGDRRDPSPLPRRAWVETRGASDWLWSVGPDDFFDFMAHYNPLPAALTVHGSWSDCVDELVEHIDISSAFVRPEVAGALANALRNCEYPSDCRMPKYGEEEDGAFSPFDLLGWIEERDGSDRRLDRFDEAAADISYPPQRIAETFAKMAELSADAEKRNWRPANSTSNSAVCRIWGEKPFNQRDRPYRHGNQLAVSVSTLTELCRKLGRELVFCVMVSRDRQRSYSSDDDTGYAPASHKILILSPDGIIRDTAKDYRIG
jgi:hypothetical protein